MPVSCFVLRICPMSKMSDVRRTHINSYYQIRCPTRPSLMIGNPARISAAHVLIPPLFSSRYSSDEKMVERGQISDHHCLIGLVGGCDAADSHFRFSAFASSGSVPGLQDADGLRVLRGSTARPTLSHVPVRRLRHRNCAPRQSGRDVGRLSWRP